MAVFPAGLDAEIGKVDEQEVCEGIDYLGGVWGCVVILIELSVPRNRCGRVCRLLRTS